MLPPAWDEVNRPASSRPWRTSSLRSLTASGLRPIGGEGTSIQRCLPARSGRRGAGRRVPGCLEFPLFEPLPFSRVTTTVNSIPRSPMRFGCVVWHFTVRVSWRQVLRWCSESPSCCPIPRDGFSFLLTAALVHEKAFLQLYISQLKRMAQSANSFFVDAKGQLNIMPCPEPMSPAEGMERSAEILELTQQFNDLDHAGDGHWSRKECSYVVRYQLERSGSFLQPHR
mmetsp:Transcript_15361/g.48296  ORF Transcript_15361/g.48296 Transcript_15361/m.48296 type:complete len:227 (-) Transcript_15361:269-949(-)